MSLSFIRSTVLTLVTLYAAGLAAPPADAAMPLRLPWHTPKPAAAPPAPERPAIAAVGAPLSADPVGGPARGTVIMVHAGGWAGHDTNAQAQLMTRPASLFLERGWRVVSIDYHEGTAGLRGVLDAAGAELARNDHDRPLCIYGESSGAHLALVAAARLRSIDCVMGLGTPTDVPLYETDGAVSADPLVRLVASQMSRFFGTTLAETATWDPVRLTASIRADVLLIREADDMLVPAAHSTRFQAASPTTQTVELHAGDRAVAATHFVHGTVSEEGRASYAAALGAFADRAVSAGDGQRDAARTGCAQVNRSIKHTGPLRLQSALRCLARTDPQPLSGGRSRWRRTSVMLRGHITAARIWAGLRTTSSGRHALAAAAKRHVRISVHTADRSRITLRRAPTIPRATAR